MNSLAITWTLRSHGWARVTVADGQGEAEVVASYVTDGPEQFLYAIARLLLGDDETRAEFEGEPQVYRWFFRREGSEVGIRLVVADDSRVPDGSGTVLWSARHEITSLARSAVRAFDRIAHEVGAETYESQWGRPFPRAELEVLRTALQGLSNPAAASRVSVPWQSCADAFGRTLRRRGVDPGAVREVGVAWDAFEEFLRMEIEGIEGPEGDADGFIVQWGRWDWNDGRPALSFGRQLAVIGGSGGEDSDGQPEYWQVELQLVFGEDPAWADLDALGRQDTGFDFGEIGAPRADALARVRRFVDSCPPLAALWRAEPILSGLTFERAG